MGPPEPQLSCSCCTWWRRPGADVPSCWGQASAGVQGHPHSGAKLLHHSWWQAARQGDHNDGLGRMGREPLSCFSSLSAVHSSELIYRLVFLSLQEISLPFRNLFAPVTFSILIFSILKTKGLEYFFCKCQVHLKPPNRTMCPPKAWWIHTGIHIYFGDKRDSVWSGMC